MQPDGGSCGGIVNSLAAPRAQGAIQMPFQHHADVFAHGAAVGAGLPGQIVIEGFGQVQFDVAVALGAAAGYSGDGARRRTG